MDEPLVLSAISNGVGRLTFNRPAARNAMSIDMVKLFSAELAAMEADPAVRCLVLQGAGEHFVAGGDVKSWGRLLSMKPDERAADFRRRLTDMKPIVRQLAQFPKPLIVAVRGFAAGAGITFVAAADFVVAEASATFVFAHVRLSLVPDMGLSYFLPRAVGERQAARLSMLGGQIDAGEAHRLGLVTDLVAPGELDQTIDAITGTLLALPRVALAETRQVVRGAAAEFEQRFEREIQGLETCSATDDFVEAVTAFLERRKPRFG
jgi:2-(1,2-epoxy-1,2-dihydrophenyl)acetyl-CoA isomerase